MPLSLVNIVLPKRGPATLARPRNTIVLKLLESPSLVLVKLLRI